MQVKIPQGELYNRLLELGWALRKIDLKNGTYVASGYNQSSGQDYEALGKSERMALLGLIRYAERANKVRTFAKTAAWTHSFLDQKEDIAQAYSKMPIFDEKAVPAWQALAAESKVQADAIRQQIKVTVVDDPEPYLSAQEMVKDIHQNKNFKVSRANSEHPVWTVEDNINFRIVHDVLGHGQSGGDFSWRGENLACGVHFPLVSPLAREALFTECIGQVAYQSYFRGFGPQKVGFLSEFLAEAQKNEGEHIWVPHGGLPNPMMPQNQAQGGDALDQAPGMAGVLNTPGQWVNPNPQYASPPYQMPSAVMQGFDFKSKNVSPGRQYDPNAFWVPEQQGAPINPQRDSDADYIDIMGTFDNATKIDTEWQAEDEKTQDRAIMNAFRVALLSPRKHIKWNAAHYQAIMNADPATKAVDLWHMLEAERERHNQALGYPEGSHLSYKEQLKYLAHELQVESPLLSDAEAHKEAKEIIFRKTKEFEQQLAEEDVAGETSELRRYNQARRLVDTWLKENYTPVKGWKPGQMALAAKDDDWKDEYDYRNAKGDTESCRSCEAYHAFSKLDLHGTCKMFDARVDPKYTCDEWTDDKDWKKKHSSQDQLFAPSDDWKPIDMTGFAQADSKYGAFMGTHLDAIAAVGEHIDAIRDAALEDLKEGGKGFHFRNAVMNMNLPGVNPKVASFAWLLLAPLTSELGIIDAHLLRGLRRTEKDMNPRDYYKLERMQRAAKDATGYSHIPLGLYHWGLWDTIRNPGNHSDHSPLRILDPTPWDSVEWDSAQTAKAGPWVGPIHFENARGHMENAALQFDRLHGTGPAGMVPDVPGPGQPSPQALMYAVK